MIQQYRRLTDAQWEVIREFLPMQRKRKHDLREVFNAILWITRTGAQWRMLDSNFPPWSVVYYYFNGWTKSGVIARMNHALNRLDRAGSDREEEPSLILVDSQSIKLAPMIGKARGKDGNKKVNGRKRQVLVDTQGRIWATRVHAANEHDSKAGSHMIHNLLAWDSRLTKIVGDMAYRGTFERAVKALGMAFETPMRSARQKGFVVEAKRWVVERTFAWFNFFRRLTKDYEREPRNAGNFLYLANISMIIARLST